MILGRILKPELIRLELETSPLEPPAESVDHERLLWDIKEAALAELAALVAESGRIGSVKRLTTDLINREKKATTGLSHGVAIPHVRTREAREFIAAFARSTPGIDFDCLDGEPAHAFIVLVAPPYDDTLYLRIYKQLAEAIAFHDAARQLREAQDEGEVIRVFKQM